MQCRYCSAVNIADSNRCHRCGRRHSADAESALDVFPFTNTRATAPDPAYYWDERSAYSTAPSLSATVSPARPTYQRSLFDSQVVQMPSVGRPPRSTNPRSTNRGSVTPRRRKSNPNQHAFDFELIEDQSQMATMTVISPDHIYCDAPVAQPVHRLMAAALDSSMILIAVGLFMLTFHVCGGAVVLNAKTAGLYGCIYAVLWFFYRALFGICGADTPGMIWTNLRLVNFEGNPPDREQRVYRMFGGVLGILSAGLGLIWSLVDEEQLTWHDHISKTFPSPQRI
jgi:uncharacterized RDD family membrane protein YckC